MTKHEMRQKDAYCVHSQSYNDDDDVIWTGWIPYTSTSN